MSVDDCFGSLAVAQHVITRTAAFERMAVALVAAFLCLLYPIAVICRVRIITNHRATEWRYQGKVGNQEIGRCARSRGKPSLHAVIRIVGRSRNERELPLAPCRISFLALIDLVFGFWQEELMAMEYRRYIFRAPCQGLP